MNPGIIFAIVTAIVFGIWTVFHQKAATHINSLLGAIIVSLTAAILGAIILIPNLKTSLTYSTKGLIFVILTGVCALAVDYFALKAYGSGLQISVAGPIIIGGSIAVAAFIGLFLGESLTLIKVLGLTLVLAGAAILAAFVS
ncbi:MAG: EamA family transporter [archaeon]